MSAYVLVTGATGLVGRYLVRDLLLDGHQLALLIRPTDKQDVRERLESILQPWESDLGKLLPRPVVLSGDVTEEGLGLNAETTRWVATHCDRVIHNAAILTFHGADRSGEPWRTNLQGTQNVLEFCRRTKLRQFHYVSTAYVCGTRTGRILENELDCQQTFRNDYEHSKFLAEKAVREADFIESLTVYRPAVIAGDSRTGFTSTYHGLYMYLQLMSVINRNTEPDETGIRNTHIRLDMTGDEPRNIVPVDWVSDVICHLFGQPEAHGRTYHLAPSVPITPRQIVEAGYKFFNSRGVEFCGREGRVDSNLSNLERATYENKTMYEAYEDSDPAFDTSNLSAYAGSLPCPEIDEAMLYRFWRYGEEDRWGRRRPAPIEIPYRVGEILQEIYQEHQRAESHKSRSDLDRRDRSNANWRSEHPQDIGLDLMGPGGGQLTLRLLGRRIIHIEPGIAESGIVVRIPAEDFVNLISGCGESLVRSRSLKRAVGEDEQRGPLELVARVLRSMPHSFGFSENDSHAPQGL